jgi:hypothetical protein
VLDGEYLDQVSDRHLTVLVFDLRQAPCEVAVFLLQLFVLVDSQQHLERRLVASLENVASQIVVQFNLLTGASLDLDQLKSKISEEQLDFVLDIQRF